MRQVQPHNDRSADPTSLPTGARRAGRRPATTSSVTAPSAPDSAATAAAAALLAGPFAEDGRRLTSGPDPAGRSSCWDLDPRDVTLAVADLQQRYRLGRHRAYDLAEKLAPLAVVPGRWRLVDLYAWEDWRRDQALLSMTFPVPHPPRPPGTSEGAPNPGTAADRTAEGSPLPMPMPDPMRRRRTPTTAPGPTGPHGPDPEAPPTSPPDAPTDPRTEHST